VAVDPKVISFGTKLYIDGYGYAEAADKGRDIKGNRVDVFLETASDARRWGVRRVNMYILE
jgi:3D (Asp-Asp-Asp) domain-containing protein